MILAGLTGLYCAGKNHAAALLESRGFPVLDVDTLGHEALRAEREALVRRFGPGAMGPDGWPDRRLLGRRVFGRREELAALEAIVHPAANRLTEQWIAAQRNGAAWLCVINAALIHKSSAFSRLDALIVVRAPFPVRLFRARRRDGLSLGELLRRFASQRDFPFTGRGGRAPVSPEAQLFPVSADIYTIDNSGFPGSERALEKQIDAILEGLCHGKEKVTAHGGFGGGVSGDCGRGRDSLL